MIDLIDKRRTIMIFILKGISDLPSVLAMRKVIGKKIAKREVNLEDIQGPFCCVGRA